MCGGALLWGCFCCFFTVFRVFLLLRVEVCGFAELPFLTALLFPLQELEGMDFDEKKEINKRKQMILEGKVRDGASWAAQSWPHSPSGKVYLKTG